MTLQNIAIWWLLVWLSGCDAREFWAGRVAEGTRPISCQGSGLNRPYARPLCAQQQCVACTEAGGDALCRREEPYCASEGDLAGRCVVCREDSHCGARACWFNRCVDRCINDSSCEGGAGVCVLDALGPHGRCAPKDEVRFVRSGAPCGQNRGEDAQHPLCSLDDALVEVKARAAVRRDALKMASAREPLAPPVRVLRLLPGGDFQLYTPISGLREPLYLIGEDTNLRQQTRIGGLPTSDGVSVGSGAVVGLQRLTVENTRSGVLCEDPRGMEGGRSHLLLRQVTVRGAREGALISRGCDLLLDQVTLTGNTGGALLMEDAGHYQITNTVIADNTHREGPVVQFRGVNEGGFLFNSIINNSSPAAPVLSCGSIARSIESTVLLQNQPVELQRSTVSGQCALVQVVMDTEPPPGQLVYRGAPELRNKGLYGDYHLVDSAATRGCCSLRVQRSAGPALRHDRDGATPAERVYLGAYELR